MVVPLFPISACSLNFPLEEGPAGFWNSRSKPRPAASSSARSKDLSTDVMKL